MGGGMTTTAVEFTYVLPSFGPIWEQAEVWASSEPSLQSQKSSLTWWVRDTQIGRVRKGQLYRRTPQESRPKRPHLVPAYPALVAITDMGRIIIILVLM